MAIAVEAPGRRLTFSGLAAGRLVGPAAAAALLGISRLVPETGFGLWLRLAAATLVVLLPGRLAARALGQRTVAATLVWSAGLLGAGMALTFALGSSLDTAIAFELAAGAVALGFLVTERRLEGPRLPTRGRVVRGLLVAGGLGLGAAVWFAQGALSGDAFFHLARIRKLDVLGSLSLHDVSEFARGGLHPGYAFPLWHGWIAAVANLAGVDPTSVATHESSVLVPLALVLAFEMGWAVFRSTGLAVATMLATLALKALASGHAGVYTSFWEPATAATQLFVPATVALFFLLMRRPSRPLALTLAVGAAALSLVHPTYSLFLAIPLAAFVVARILLTRGSDVRRGVTALVVFGVPMLLVYAWLRPIVDQTVALHLGPGGLAQSLHHYRGDVIVHSLSRYNLAPSRVDRAGSVAVAALVLTPLALLGRRRRWAALVLGATVVLLALDLWPLVFPHFSNAVSLSQSRRAASFVPYAVAFAGGIAVLAAWSRVLTLAAALGCGIWLELSYGGDFGLHAPRSEPALAVWIGLYGAIAALVLGTALVWTRRDRLPALARNRGLTVALAATLFVLPVAAHGFSSWTPKKTTDPNALTPGLVRFLQTDVPRRAVVFGDLETSYRAAAYAPVYPVAVPPSHVANTKPNRIFVRRRAVLRFFTHPSLRIPENWHAGWLILRRDEPAAAVERDGARPVYEDDRFVVFRLPSAPLPLSR